MSIDDLGGCFSWKKSTAPQAKITIAMPSGTSVQKISSGMEPWICTGTGCLSFRYFTANTQISRATRTVKKMVTPKMKKNSASTLGDSVEADSGNSGKY